MTRRKVMRKKQRVKLLTLGFNGILRITQWLVQVCLKQIEEVALGSLASGNCANSMEEATEAITWIMGGSVGETERKTIEDYLRAQTLEWWPTYPERQLLTELYQRKDRREKECGSPDSGRRPSHEEGLRIARPLLADIPDTSRLDSEWESGVVSKVLAALLLPPIRSPSPETLQPSFELSETSKVYSDAIDLIDGQRRRPALKPRPKADHRPVNPATLLRDIQIQIVIELLRRVGIRPRGTYVSGCCIAAEASGLSEQTTKDIWEMPSIPAMEKHGKAIAERTGPFHTAATWAPSGYDPFPFLFEKMPSPQR